MLIDCGNGKIIDVIVLAKTVRRNPRYIASILRRGQCSYSLACKLQRETGLPINTFLFGLGGKRDGRNDADRPALARRSPTKKTV